jgi:uncharacterized membrane protein YkvA (DUF1232 family)
MSVAMGINEDLAKAKAHHEESGADRAQPALPLDPVLSEEEVRQRFWPKVKRVIARIPFADDLVAAYYCAIDSRTPLRVRGVLMAALGYFILPTDLVPDFIVALGFSDDATVLATTLAVVGSHIKPRHRERARKALGLPPQKDEDEMPENKAGEDDTLLDVTPVKGASG